MEPAACQQSPPVQEKPLYDCTDQHSERTARYAAAMCEAFGHFAAELGFTAPIGMMQCYRAFAKRQQMFVAAKRQPEYWRLGNIVAGSFGHYAIACCEQVYQLIGVREMQREGAGIWTPANESADLEGAVAVLQEAGYLHREYKLPS